MCDSMEYKFNCDVKASDLWKMSMVRTYRSFLGVINIVFTVSMIAMTVKLWPGSEDFFRVMEILCCLIFPVFQPLAIWGRSYTRVIRQDSMIVIKTDDSYGYMIMNRVMGEQKDAFYNDLVALLKNQKR